MRLDSVTPPAVRGISTGRALTKQRCDISLAVPALPSVSALFSSVFGFVRGGIGIGLMYVVQTRHASMSQDERQHLRRLGNVQHVSTPLACSCSATLCICHCSQLAYQ